MIADGPGNWCFECRKKPVTGPLRSARNHWMRRNLQDPPAGWHDPSIRTWLTTVFIGCDGASRD
jgi:hypothetical protein